MAMLPLFILLACGEKAEDTSTEDTLVEVEDTATEDTGSGTSEGNEGRMEGLVPIKFGLGYAEPIDLQWWMRRLLCVCQEP